MKSSTHALNSWSSTGTESLLSHINTAEDVDSVIARLNGMAKDGSIEFDGIKVTLDRAVKMIREYIGRELHNNYDVMKKNGLYVAS